MGDTKKDITKLEDILLSCVIVLYVSVFVFTGENAETVVSVCVATLHTSWQ